jgi:hypothetical protein
VRKGLDKKNLPQEGKMLKRNLGLAVFVIALTCVKLQAQTLDDSIKNAASELSGNLAEGTVVAVINFQSQSTRLANYVIDELNNAIVNIGKLKTVDRRRLDEVRSELEFNMSGEVSDESAQSIGRMLGAQNIIMGSIEIIGSMYRIRFQAIATETATIQYAFSDNIRNDSVLESLLQGTNYLVDFTFQERLSASALNLLFGSGSFFVEGDKFGGGVTAALEGLGVVGIVFALAHKAGNYNDEDKLVDTYDAYPFFIGIGFYVGGAIFGVIRAQTYHKPGSQVAAAPFNGLALDVVPTAHKDIGVKISYTWRF